MTTLRQAWEREDKRCLSVGPGGYGCQHPAGHDGYHIFNVHSWTDDGQAVTNPSNPALLAHLRSEPNIPTAQESARERLDAAIVEQAQALDEYAATLQAHEDAKVRLTAAEDEYENAQHAYRAAVVAAERT